MELPAIPAAQPSDIDDFLLSHLLFVDPTAFIAVFERSSAIRAGWLLAAVDDAGPAIFWACFQFVSGNGDHGDTSLYGRYRRWGGVF